MTACEITLATTLTIAAATSCMAQCTFQVSPLAPFVDSLAQNIPLTVTASAPGCAWTASTTAAFLTLPAPPSGTGSGTLSVAAAVNLSGVERNAVITIAGQSVTLTQRITSSTFADVLPPDFYFDGANLMRERSITAGCSTTPLQYCPTQNTTRGQMAIFLIRGALGGDAFSYPMTPYFDDVPATHPFFRWIQKLRELGITSGCGTRLYCPDDSVTRGQMAIFVLRLRYGGDTTLVGPSTPYFTDVPANYPYFNWIQRLRLDGVTGGCASDRYCPEDPVTRGQMAIFVMRAGFNRLFASGTPVLSSMSPPSAAPGSIVDVIFTGNNTHFAANSSLITGGGAGITVSNITAAAATSLTARFTIPAAAAAGSRSVVIQTGTETVVMPNAFLVTGAPAIQSVSPNTGQTGRTVAVTVAGLNTSFAAGNVSADFGAGITPGAINVTNATSFSTQLAISAAAATGSRTVVVSQGTINIATPNAFTVAVSSLPALSSVTPSIAPVGEKLSLSVQGMGTSFRSGTTALSAGAGISVDSVMVSNSTQLTAGVTVSPDAAPGARTITVTSGAESVSYSAALSVVGPLISITAPADLAFVNTPSITVTGKVGTANASIAVNGVNASVASGSFTAAIPLMEGRNTITAVATTPAGASSSSNIQLTLDTTPPRITITSPVDN